jgi:predicted nuclease of restriction endonuclease-like RecB superfamily
LGYDYRYIRGLSTLLDRRCVFRSNVEVNPAEIRRRLFELANKQESAIALDERSRILETISSEVNLPVDEIESSLYADLEDEFIFEKFTPLNAESLVKWYNLSLTQTLLFYSTEAQFSASGNWQHLFWEVKKLGLIYEVQREGGVYRLKVDGPFSLFKLTRRYGTALAKLVPAVIKGENWIINAKILRGSGDDDKKLLDLKLESKKYSKLLGIKTQPQIAIDKYDSEVERNFATRFEALNTGWKLQREPEPIPVGNSVILPDFSFEMRSAKVYMEVVGFWTSEYLKRKMKKLELLTGVDIIVAVDRELNCQRMNQLGKKLDLIYFKRKIPLQPILSHLRKVEEKIKVSEIEFISRQDLLSALGEPVIDVRDLASKLDVMEDTVWELVKKQDIPGYTVFPSILIKDSKLKEIQEKLEETLDEEKLTLHKASTIIEKLCGKHSTLILEKLGYKVTWNGIDPKNAKIQRENPLNIN